MQVCLQVCIKTAIFLKMLITLHFVADSAQAIYSKVEKARRAG